MYIYIFLPLFEEEKRLIPREVKIENCIMWMVSCQQHPFWPFLRLKISLPAAFWSLNFFETHSELDQLWLTIIIDDHISSFIGHRWWWSPPSNSFVSKGKKKGYLLSFVQCFSLILQIYYRIILESKKNGMTYKQPWSPAILLNEVYKVKIKGCWGILTICLRESSYMVCRPYS